VERVDTKIDKEIARVEAMHQLREKDYMIAGQESVELTCTPNANNDMIAAECTHANVVMQEHEYMQSEMTRMCDEWARMHVTAGNANNVRKDLTMLTTEMIHLRKEVERLRSVRTDDAQLQLATEQAKIWGKAADERACADALWRQLRTAVSECFPKVDTRSGPMTMIKPVTPLWAALGIPAQTPELVDNNTWQSQVGGAASMAVFIVLLAIKAAPWQSGHEDMGEARTDSQGKHDGGDSSS